MLPSQTEADPSAESTSTAPATESAPRDLRPAPGFTRLYIFLGMFQGLPDAAAVFSTRDEAKARFFEYMEVNYDAYAKYTNDEADTTTIPGWDTDYDDTDILIQDVLVRECETEGCLNFYVGSENLPEYHCEAHQWTPGVGSNLVDGARAAGFIKDESAPGAGKPPTEHASQVMREEDARELAKVKTATWPGGW